MAFEIRETKQKDAIYKSLYISGALESRLVKMAADNKTSFNNLVVSMIHHCLKEIDEEEKK